jgi:hypothetical protein
MSVRGGRAFGVRPEGGRHMNMRSDPVSIPTYLLFVLQSFCGIDLVIFSGDGSDLI